MDSFRVLSALLSYPEEELIKALPELRAALEREAVVPPLRLVALFDHLGGTDLLDLQQDYVSLFDRSRALSLHLFEHVHGESRDRGQAMVDLAQLYRAEGLEIDARELPDYVPLFLEFLSCLPFDRAMEHLRETAHIMAALAERLKKRDSVYAGLFAALAALADVIPQGDIVTPAEENEDLDQQWEDEAVSFAAGLDPAGCAPACPVQQSARAIAADIGKGH